MKQINELDYLYASGRIRALEGSLLNREKTIYMIDARTPEDAFSQLPDSGYPIPQSVTAEALEVVLQAERRRIFDLFSDILPDKDLVDFFKVRYDVHNLKVLVKCAGNYESQKPLLLDSGTIGPEKLVEAFKEKDFKLLSPLLQAAVEVVQDLLAKTNDPQACDIELDKACLLEMAQIAQKTNIPFLISYVRLLIDANNLRTLVRVQRMNKDNAFLLHALVSGGNIPILKLSSAFADSSLDALFSTSLLNEAASVGVKIMRQQASMTQLDFQTDNAMTVFMRPARMKAYGPSIVVAYLVAKESEITALRTILTGRILNLPPEQITERIREHYV